ncbi:hypothetical protein [Spirosoma montaniterrae]|uniref:Anti-sigma factor n=1 Tax=Spirosoma montaniterrae TaxID=1178516 RepID=A0A1P9X4S2_9BACT|nr:hypothetical protein [Spirosoma montaniterrae]AQG82619.1 hypothetical protein AWR27_20890 [Spirosoma montaniterrae]
MKKDNLERFVRDNREAFDDHEPPNDLWQKIERGLDTPPGTTRLNGQSPFRQVHSNAEQINNSRFGGLQIGWPNMDWRVAASVALLLLAGGFWYMNHQYGVTQQPDVVAASPMYAREVVQYTRLIDNKRAELKQMTEDNPVLYQEFATDLDRLERSYQLLRAALPQNPNQETLIEAMIQNLQLQIDLLNEQLRVIERIKQQTHENPV